MPVSLEQFFATLASGDLCVREELAALRLEAAEKQLDAPACAERLVAAGRLTAYQGQRLCDGAAPKIVLGDYLILDELGGGGMGRVYKAIHRRMDRVVALKVMAPDRIASQAALKRFHREVRAAARLIHPHIVTAFDAGEQDGTHYLVMEYVEGQDLATVVRENGALPVIDALDCVLQVARGLQFAHTKGVIHRDIKPGNLLLDWAGHVRVLDMGLASLDRSLNKPVGEKERHEAAEESNESVELTQHGQIVGTLDYMAPEQAERAKHLDGRVDIYALGCTLFHLLVGRAPFAGETAEAKLRAHREAEIPSLVALRDDVPPQVDLLFCKMIAKRSDQRPANVGELIEILEECLLAARAKSSVAAQTASSTEQWSDDVDERFNAVSTAQLDRQEQPQRDEPSTVGEGLGLTEEIATPAPVVVPIVSVPVEAVAAVVEPEAREAPAAEAQPVELPAAVTVPEKAVFAEPIPTPQPATPAQSELPAPVESRTIPAMVLVFAGLGVLAVVALIIAALSGYFTR